MESKYQTPIMVIKEHSMWYFDNNKYYKSLPKKHIIKRLGVKEMINKLIILAGGMGTRMSPLLQKLLINSYFLYMTNH